MANRKTPSSVDVSVLIATRDNAEQIGETLDHLERQRLNELSWEIVVVDNGSSDDTSAVLTSALRGVLPLTALYEPEPGKNRALTKALQVARGRLLIFTDDDIVPHESWIVRLHRASERWTDDSIFGGPILPRFPHGTPSWISTPDFSYASIAYGRFAPESNEGPIAQAPFGANIALRRRLFDEFAFDVTIGPSGRNYAQGSEYELTRRLNDRGYRNIFVPDALVEHVIRPNQVEVEWLLQRAHRWGRGNERLTPSDGRFRIASVPVQLWLKLACARLIRPVGRALPPRHEFAVAKHYAFLSGRALECRACSSSNPKA